jgi:hypothetical protein
VYVDNRRGDDGTVVRERRGESSTDVRLLRGGNVVRASACESIR